jgi:AraC-like DNA-binding protein
MLHDAPGSLEARIGWLAYALAALRHLCEIPMTVDISLDHAPPVTCPARAVLVGKVGRLQGGIRLLADAVPDDGLFDVAVLMPLRRRQWPTLAWALLRRHPTTPTLTTSRATHIEITAGRAQPRELDGDLITPVRTMTVRVQPGPLWICVPNPPTSRIPRAHRRKPPDPDRSSFPSSRCRSLSVVLIRRPRPSVTGLARCRAARDLARRDACARPPGRRLPVPAAIAARHGGGGGGSGVRRVGGRRRDPASSVACRRGAGLATVRRQRGGDRAALARAGSAVVRLREPVTVDEMARRAHLSRRQFTRTFRAETGMSPWRWLLEQRLTTARRMIENTDEPIESISWRCGFPTAAAFRAQFKQFAGEPPSAYRARVRAASAAGMVVNLFGGRRGRRPAASRPLRTHSVVTQRHRIADVDFAP